MTTAERSNQRPNQRSTRPPAERAAERAINTSLTAGRFAEPADDTRRGFRPAGRRRNRLAAGVALGAIAVGGNIAVYAALDSSEPVVQVVRDVPAGEQITGDMLRTVDADVDATVNVIPAADLDSLVGQYAKVRLVSGSLVVRAALQADPLLGAGNAVVALEVKAAELPIGLRERVPVQLVVPGSSGTSTSDPTGDATSGAPLTIEGRVVGLPIESDGGIATRSVSVEVAAADAPRLAAADAVRIVLLVPSDDPAQGESGE